MQKGSGRQITRLVTLCVALDEHNQTNGCLEVAKGEHKHGYLGACGKNIDERVAASLDFTPHRDEAV